MINLTGPSVPQSAGASTPRDPDDRSDNAHRQLIGWIGLLLPWILILIAAVRPTNPSARWTMLDSISAYYYTGAVVAFVGMLVALALFLITYQGYDNKNGWVDRLAARIAGGAALLVAFFPTSAPQGFPEMRWWTPWNGVVHYFSAIVLFAMFGVFCLWLFRLGTSDPAPADKRRRNHIYVVCGIVILISMAWAGIAGWKNYPIFIPESLALTAFATSWLIKGRAPTTIANVVRKTFSKAPQP
jgi:hypothetical protein